MASNKVYSGTWHSALANMTGQSIDFAIRSTGRELRIKSISLTHSEYDPAHTTRYDWRTANTIITLTVGAGGNRICYEYNAPSVAPAFMGNYIEIYEPFQYFFDGFFVANELPLNLWIFNNNGAQRDYYNSVTIETEEKTMFR